MKKQINFTTRFHETEMAIITEGTRLFADKYSADPDNRTQFIIAACSRYYVELKNEEFDAQEKNARRSELLNLNRPLTYQELTELTLLNERWVARQLRNIGRQSASIARPNIPADSKNQYILPADNKPASIARPNLPADIQNPDIQNPDSIPADKDYQQPDKPLKLSGRYHSTLGGRIILKRNGQDRGNS